MNTPMVVPEDPAPEAAVPQAGTSSRNGAWAGPVDKLKVGVVPTGATNINVEGRQVAGALQGFGQLWQKTYRIRLSGVEVTPAAVMAVWKANFPKYQPPENRFYPPMVGIRPGEVLFIEGKVPAFPGTPSIMPVASGVMVLYVDDESFSIMTPEGFPEAGWNTFSASDDDGCTVIQIQSLARAADPLYELYLRYLGSATQQERVWHHVLGSLAEEWGVKSEVTMTKVLVDPQVQWSQARNIFKSAAILTVFYKLGAPIRWLGNLGRRGKTTE